MSRDRSSSRHRRSESDTSFSDTDYESKEVREVKRKKRHGDRHGRMPEMHGPGGFSAAVVGGSTGTAEQLVTMHTNAPLPDVDYLAGIEEEQNSIAENV